MKIEFKGSHEWMKWKMSFEKVTNLVNSLRIGVSEMSLKRKESKQDIDIIEAPTVLSSAESAKSTL